MSVRGPAFARGRFAPGYDPRRGRGSRLALATAALDRTITTVAGGEDDSGKLVTDVNISFPKNITFDPAGNLVYADDVRNLVRRVDKDTGIVTTIAGNGLLAAGECGIDCPPSDDGAVPQLATETRFGNIGIAGGTGLAYDARGILYIADTWNERVRAVNTNPPGTEALPASGQLIAPGWIATVAGTGFFGFGPDGPALASDLAFPSDIVIDTDGTVIFTEFWSGRVRHIDAGGTVTTIAGHLIQQPWGPDMACDVGAANGDGGPATEAALCAPLGLGFDPHHDYLYVSEWTFPFGSCCGLPEFGLVRRIDRNGIITTFAGGGDQFPGDGLPATDLAMTPRPGAVAFDDGGNVFFAESSAGLIRRVDAQGILNTVAGVLSFECCNAYSAAHIGGPALDVTIAGPDPLVMHAGRLYYGDYAGVIRWVEPGPDGRIEGRPSETIGEVGSRAGLKGPGPALFDRQGNLIFAGSIPRIQRIDRLGNVTTLVDGSDASGHSGDGGRAIDARVSAPGLALAGNGDLYFTDIQERRVRRVRARAGVLTPDSTIELVTTLGFQPGGLTVRGTQVLISEFFGTRVWAYDLPTRRLAPFAGTGAQGEGGDGGPALDATLVNVINVIDDPAHAAVYLVDQGASTLRKVDRDGIISTLLVLPDLCPPFGCRGAPTWGAVIADYLFVNDDRFQLVYRLDLLDPAASPEIVAGFTILDGPAGFSGDDVPATQSRLSGPEGIAFDAAGKLHLLDALNNRERRIGLLDLMPGHYPNRVAMRSHATVEAALLGDHQLDAHAIDPASIRLAGAPAGAVRFQDVDGDGRTDLVFTVRIDAMAIAPGDREVPVTFHTTDGRSFTDADWITVER